MCIYSRSPSPSFLLTHSSYLSPYVDLITYLGVSCREGQRPNKLCLCSSALLTHISSFYLLPSMLFLLLSKFSCSEHFICQSCMSKSILPLPLLVSPVHICHPAPLSQGDPASQSPLSVRLGPLLILLHLSCLSPSLWEEFMTVP